MAQSLNATFIQQSEDIIQSKKEALLQFFEKKGHKAEDLFDNNLWFFSDINEDQGNILWSVIGQTIGQDQVFDENIESQPVIESFVQKLLDTAKQIHLRIVSFQKNIEYFQDDATNYGKYSKIIDANQNEYNQENALVISYVDQVAQISEIQKFYKLKYKCGTIHQNYQALYPENSNRSTCLSIDQTVEAVTFVVMGKRLDKNLGDETTLGEDFRELAQVVVPLNDIYQCVKPRHFALPTIPQCYLRINYQDQSMDAPYLDEVSLNLRFDVRLGFQERKDVMKLQETNLHDLTEKFNGKLQQKVEQMNQLLSPFKEDPTLHYVLAKGIGEPKDFPAKEQTKPTNQDKNKDEIKPKSRETCCVIW